MSEEKNDNQQNFLSGHEELLNSINKKKDEAETETVEETVAEEVPAVEPEAPAEKPAAEPVVEEAPVEEPKPAPAPEPVVEEEPEVVAEPEPVIEEVQEEVAKPEPVVEEEPEVVAEPEPVVEEVQEEVVVMDQKIVKDVPPVVTETPAHAAPKKEKPANHNEAVERRHNATEQAEVKEVLNFINKYVKPAGIVVVAICALVLANSLIRSGRMKKEAKADSALLEASSAADYQAILDDYGKTPSAPLAMLGLAQETFNAAKVAEASALYADFLKKYPNHEMAAQASFNEITCKEALGQTAEAVAAYGAFWDANKDSHLAPVALLGKGRCLEAMGNFAEAKQVYDDIIVFYEDSGWAQLAESNLSVVNAKLK